MNDITFDNDKQTIGFDGESFTGHAFFVGLNRGTRDSYVSASYSESSPTFRADNGFEPSNNRRKLQSFFNRNFRWDEGPVQTIVPRVNFGRVWNFDDVMKDEWIRISLNNSLSFAQMQLNFQYLTSNERLSGLLFKNITNYYMNCSFRPNSLLAGGGSFNYGRQIARRELAMGYETTLGCWLDLQPTDRLLIENWYDYTVNKDVDTDETYFKGYIARSRISYQLRKELSLRFVVQYDDFSDSWDFDPLVTYRLNPFSVLHVGSTMDVATYQENEPGGNDQTRRLSARQFFMKIQYVFQM